VLIAKGKPAQQERIIEFLARDSDVPIDEIARLCVKEQAGLEESARLKHFLPIFLVRNVREQLKQNHRIKGPTPP
jgi:hypothetical protein